MTEEQEEVCWVCCQTTHLQQPVHQLAPAGDTCALHGITTRGTAKLGQQDVFLEHVHLVLAVGQKLPLLLPIIQGSQHTTNLTPIPGGAS